MMTATHGALRAFRSVAHMRYGYRGCRVALLRAALAVRKVRMMPHGSHAGRRNTFDDASSVLMARLYHRWHVADGHYSRRPRSAKQCTTIATRAMSLLFAVLLLMVAWHTD